MYDLSEVRSLANLGCVSSDDRFYYQSFSFTCNPRGIICLSCSYRCCHHDPSGVAHFISFQLTFFYKSLAEVKVKVCDLSEVRGSFRYAGVS